MGRAARERKNERARRWAAAQEVRDGWTDADHEEEQRRLAEEIAELIAQRKRTSPR